MLAIQLRCRINSLNFQKGKNKSHQTTIIIMGLWCLAIITSVPWFLPWTYTYLPSSLPWSSSFGLLCRPLILSVLELNMSICDMTALHSFIHNDSSFWCTTNSRVCRRGLLTGWRTNFWSSILIMIFVKCLRTGGKLSGTANVSMDLTALLPNAFPTGYVNQNSSLVKLKNISTMLTKMATVWSTLMVM